MPEIVVLEEVVPRITIIDCSSFSLSQGDEDYDLFLFGWTSMYVPPIQII